MSAWFNDFEIKNRVVYVKTTGARIPLNATIIREALAWFPFYLIEKAKSVFPFPSRNAQLNIAFLPTSPRPWYLLGVCVHRARAIITQDTKAADAIFYFEDQTISTPIFLSPEEQKKSFNFECTDISKTHVAKTFEHVFGYALSVDPKTYTGPMAVKSEINGTHDGYVAQGPCERIEGMTYQRLIDNVVDDKWVEDLRCPVIGGEIDIIFIKRRPLTSRFANTNANVTLHLPDKLLNHGERAKIKAFAKAMKLDWGGMDILRDKRDGKIYIVDVNKTDMGPPIGLSLRDKNTATTQLTQQLINLIHSKTGKEL